MIKKFAAVAAGVAVVFGGAAAHAASPSAQEIVRVPSGQMAVARRNVEVASAVNQRATALLATINDPALTGASTAEEYIAAIERMTPQIEAGRMELAQLRSQLDALPEVGAAGPDQMKAIDVMVRDFAVTIDRIDVLLKSITDLGSALKSEDEAGVKRSLASLSEGMMLLIDGQAGMFRARVALNEPDSFVYAQTISLACLYESLAAVTRGQLEFTPVEEAVSKSETALACARQRIADGRSAVTRDAGQAALSSATRVLQAGGDYAAIEAELDVFQAAELEISRLAREQMLAGTQSSR